MVNQSDVIMVKEVQKPETARAPGAPPLPMLADGSWFQKKQPQSLLERRFVPCLVAVTPGCICQTLTQLGVCMGWGSHICLGQ